MKYEVQDCIGAKFRRITRLIDGYYRINLKEFGITENQITILFALNKLKVVEQNKLCNVLALEKSTVSRNTKLLESKGFLSRTDEYRPVLELTAKGNNLVEKVLPIWERIMTELEEKIGKENLSILNKMEKIFD